MYATYFRRAVYMALVVTSPLAAQETSSGRAATDTSEWTRRSTWNVSVIQSRPQGAFGQNVGLGYGADAAWMLRLDDAGVWSIRANVGVAAYGDESRQAAFSETVGDRVTVNVSTTNYMIPFSVGPQLTWPNGIVRPYVNAGLGGIGFVTESEVKGTSSRVAMASTTNHSSLAGSWVAGGGVYLPFTVGSKHVAIDIGAQYFSGRTTRYLAPGSIVDLPAGRIAVTPLESATHTAILRIGARVQP